MARCSCGGAGVADEAACEAIGHTLELDPVAQRDIKGPGCCQRHKAQAPTPQAPILKRQTRKVANAKVLNRNTNLT